MENPVVLRTYSLSQDAQYDADRLEEAHIDSSIQDDSMGSNMSHGSNALGSFKLQVDRADLPRAIGVLDEVDEASNDINMPEPVEEIMKCPNCGSILVYGFSGHPPISRQHQALLRVRA
jgi:hypothetical protein